MCVCACVTDTLENDTWRFGGLEGMQPQNRWKLKAYHGVSNGVGVYELPHQTRNNTCLHVRYTHQLSLFIPIATGFHNEKTHFWTYKWSFFRSLKNLFKIPLPNQSSSLSNPCFSWYHHYFHSTTRATSAHRRLVGSHSHVASQLCSAATKTTFTQVDTSVSPMTTRFWLKILDQRWKKNSSTNGFWDFTGNFRCLGW